MIMATDTDTTLLTSAVVAAGVSGLVTLANFAFGGRRARKDRQRQVFGDAFGAVAAYREYPYIVRRRDMEAEAAERVRISTGLSDVQQRLTQYRASLRVEAPRVAKPYGVLVVETRKLAGRYISDAWHRAAPKSDDEVSVRDVDLSALDVLDDEYLLAVSDHLSLLPWWLCVAWRWVRSKFRRDE